MSTPTFPNATILGYPRVGPNRELKKALEAFWAGRIDEAELDAAATALQDRTVNRLVELGLSATDSSIPADFALYDQVLDATAALGALPKRFADLAGPDGEVSTQAYFTLARGDAQRQPLEMTKWFDTNYHYLVPEIGPETPFRALADRLAGIVKRQSALGNKVRPTLVGPVTYLLLSKPDEGAPEGFDPLSRLDDAVEAYRGILAQLAAAGAEWVQIDEPGLVTEAGSELIGLAEGAYRRLAEKEYDGVARPALFVTTGYGTAGDITKPGSGVAALAATGIEAVHADLLRGVVPAAEQLASLGQTRFVAGIVDGRNIWRNDLAASLRTLAGLEAAVPTSISVATTTSLQHVPHDVALEQNLPEHLPGWLAFADQKVGEVLTLAKGVSQGVGAIEAEIAASDAAAAHRAGFAGTRVDAVRARTSALTAAEFTREPSEIRAEAQRKRLNLPDLPTTTIGSFPQTGEVRRARAEFRAGKITAEQYEQFLKDEIRRVVDLQEELGLDVLVHGEPERNDMVQYFAENFDGFAATEHGWVQSYGSRCTRPSLLWGDVTRPEAFTVPWTTYAQSLTSKFMKGMLTGPVTILAWSFVRNDQPLAETANQVALALRDEIADLEAADIAVIQVDEPALRELLPLRAEDQPAYLDWSVNSFRLATSGVRPDTQIHTHLCYSEFGEIISGIDGLNADVTSIEAARSKMEVAADLKSFQYDRGVGPGVYDIHSPRVPSVEEVASLIQTGLDSIPVELFWVNPDCGLKTRGYEETVASLRNLVAATEQARKSLPAPVPA